MADRPVPERVAPVSPRVVVLIYNPIIEAEGGRKLNEVLGWNDPDWLTREYISDVREASHGIVNYAVVERIELDKWPLKRDGFAYTDASFLAAWRSRSGFHQPDAVDYPAVLRDADFARKVDANQAEELWVFAFPYAGFFESCMGGRGAIWCNGDVIPGTERVRRPFVVMGFNYERGVGEMLEDLGHRAENIMEHVFRDIPDTPPHGDWRAPNASFVDRLFGRKAAVNRGPAAVDLAGNLWRQFIRYDKTHPGAAACGNVHFAPSSQSDYDWGNRSTVLTNADDWLNYPYFTGEYKPQNCSAWGHGDMRAHHVWWMQRFPHVGGKTPSGKWHNWWRYIVQLDY